jgi:hypothetical protein
MLDEERGGGEAGPAAPHLARPEDKLKAKKDKKRKKRRRSCSSGQEHHTFLVDIFFLLPYFISRDNPSLLPSRVSSQENTVTFRCRGLLLVW